MVIKASSRGLFTDFELAAAIAHAVDRGARVINLSLGGVRYSTTELSQTPADAPAGSFRRERTGFGRDSAGRVTSRPSRAAR